jgi:hypothetical protein
MPMHNIEQPAFRIGCGLLGASYSAGRAESALAPKTHTVNSSTVSTYVLDESVAFIPTGKGLGNSVPSRARNDGRKALTKQVLDMLAMIGKNSNKETPSAHAHILSDGGIPCKSGLFFLGMY